MNVVSMMDVLLYDQTRSYKNLEDPCNRYEIPDLTVAIFTAYSKHLFLGTFS